MSGDGNDTELTPDDRRILKRIAAAARKEWPTRRAAMGGIAALAGAGSFAAGRASAAASTSDSDGDIGQPGNRVDAFLDGADANSVYADQADIINETYIQAIRSSDKTNIASGTWTNVADGESADNRNEFNSNQRFSPDESGEYLIIGWATLDDTSSDDRVGWRVRNVTDSTNTVFPGRAPLGVGTGVTVIPIGWIGTLDSAKTYTVEAQDVDSSFTMSANSRFTITRQVVHP